ncbi:thiol reductant ABC exporter subunit CydC [Alcaligenaceae bacterium C4P045]|nr:thiol reductant ABC exporter subunit CydC [Alcaligenaceae bacterium C4P045]
MNTVWRWLLPLYAERAGRLAGTVCLALIAVAAGVGLLGVSGWFLTGAALAGALSTFNLFVPSALVRMLSFVRIGARYAERLVGHAATLRLLADLRQRVFDNALQRSPRKLATFRGGDLVARLTGDVDALDAVFLFVAVPLVTALLSGAVVTAVLYAWTPAAAPVFAGLALMVVLGTPIVLVAASRRPGRDAQAQAGALRTEVLDLVEGHDALLGLGALSHTQARFAAQCAQAATARRRLAGLAVNGQAVAHLVAGAAALAVLIAGIDAVRDGTLSGALMAGLLLATMAYFESVGAVVRGAARLGAARAAAERIDAVLQAGDDPLDPAQPRAIPAQGAIVLEGVDYAYPARGSLPPQTVLRQVSLQIDAGERVALRGASGSGKSTLLNLLMRLEDPTAGAVRFAGRDLRDSAQADVHRRFALLTQDAPIFLGTLRTNLLVGNGAAQEADLWRVLDAARLGDFVRTLAHGLDTWTDESGGSLSAGQARRLCLARALLSPAPVLVLDEPTVGLDHATEQAFLADLATAASGRTVILATHAALPPGAVHRVLRLVDGNLV